MLRAGSAQRGLSTSLPAAQSMRRAINSNTATPAAAPASTSHGEV